MRLCVDYKTTINKIIVDVKHPLLRIEELFAELQGLDLHTHTHTHTHTQIYIYIYIYIYIIYKLELTDSSKNILAWSTHKGIYLPNRLSFGTKPACAIFQKIVEKTLQAVKNTKNFLGDIMVTGTNTAEHLANLREVFERLK